MTELLLVRHAEAALAGTLCGHCNPVVNARGYEQIANLLRSLRAEAIDAVLGDCSLPGAHSESAAFGMARTICRRAERNVVRFIEEGNEVKPEILSYLNRLSGVVWLFGRLIERNTGVNARLRDDSKAGPKWSRAW